MGRFNTQRRLDARKRHPKGLSLVEILVTISLIGVLMAIIVTNVMDTKTTAEVKATENKLEQIASKLEQYHVIHGEFPERLEQLVKGPDGRGQMKKRGLTDSWKTEWMYRRDGRTFALSSAGPDLAHGNEDDIKYEAD